MEKMRKFKVHHQWCQDKCAGQFYILTFFYTKILNSKSSVCFLICKLSRDYWTKHEWIWRQALKLKACNRRTDLVKILNNIFGEKNKSFTGISLFFSFCYVYFTYFVWKDSRRSRMNTNSTFNTVRLSVRPTVIIESFVIFSLKVLSSEMDPAEIRLIRWDSFKGIVASGF